MLIFKSCSRSWGFVTVTINFDAIIRAGQSRLTSLTKKVWRRTF